MSYRVQFTISDDEYKDLSVQAMNGGYPNVSALCKTRALQGEDSYTELYSKMVDKIKDLPAGEAFYLRDIISTPPTLLGRWLYDNVKSGIIPDVKHLGNDGTNPERYQKL